MSKFLSEALKELFLCMSPLFPFDCWRLKFTVKLSKTQYLATFPVETTICKKRHPTRNTVAINKKRLSCLNETLELTIIPSWNRHQSFVQWEKPHNSHKFAACPHTLRMTEKCRTCLGREHLHSDLALLLQQTELLRSFIYLYVTASSWTVPNSSMLWSLIHNFETNYLVEHFSNEWEQCSLP